MSDDATSTAVPATEEDVAMAAPSTEESEKPVVAEQANSPEVTDDGNEEDGDDKAVPKTPTLEAPLEVSGKRQRSCE